eukprot:m.15230 g.15230  ORF g.15230 m.15230 type:complete len:380 (+) comp3010_c0_seq1:1616-2755(+)
MTTQGIVPPSETGPVRRGPKVHIHHQSTSIALGVPDLRMKMMARHEKKMKALMETDRALEDNLDKIRAEKALLEAEILRLRAELAAATTTIETQQAQITKLNDRLATMESELSDLHQKYNALLPRKPRKHTDLEDKFGMLQDRMEKMELSTKQQISTLSSNHQVALAAAEKRSKEAAAEATRKDIAMSAQIAQHKKDMSRQQADFQEKVESLQGAHEAELMDQTSALRQQMGSLGKADQALQERHDSQGTMLEAAQRQAALDEVKRDRLFLRQGLYKVGNNIVKAIAAGNPDVAYVGELQDYPEYKEPWTALVPKFTMAQVDKTITNTLADISSIEAHPPLHESDKTAMERAVANFESPAVRERLTFLIDLLYAKKWYL